MAGHGTEVALVAFQVWFVLKKTDFLNNKNGKDDNNVQRSKWGDCAGRKEHV